MQDKCPALQVETIHLFMDRLPMLIGDNIEAIYSLKRRRPIAKRHQASWGQVETLIEQFLSADMYLITSPVWNFNIPYTLKNYLDAIVQPGYLFTHDENSRPVGLVQGKRAICIVTSGGNYGQMESNDDNDFVQPYLRTILRFIGIEDVHFMIAQSMDGVVEKRAGVLQTAVQTARKLAVDIDWNMSEVTDNVR